MRTILVLLVVVPGLIAALANPFAALLMYVWWAIFRPELWVYSDITGLQLSFVIGALLVGRSLLAGVFPEVRHGVVVWIYLFLLAALFSQLEPVDPALGWSDLIEFLKLVTVVLLLMALVTTPARLTIIVAVMAASFGVHAAKAGLWSILQGGARFAEGFGGSYGDNNMYALAVVLVVPLLIAAGQNMPNRPLRWAFYLSVPLSAFAVISLFSRGGLLALVSSLMTLVLLQRRKMMATMAVIVVGTIGLFTLPIPEGYLPRLQTLTEGTAAFRTDEPAPDTSAAGRVHFWRVAMLMASDRPFGVGFQNYEAAYDRYDTSGGRYGYGRAAHSSLFDVLGEMGYPGAFAFVGLLLHTVVTGLLVRRRALRHTPMNDLDRLFFTMANGLVASMAGFAVGGLFLSAAFNDLTWFTVAVVGALDRLSARSYAAEARDREELVEPAYQAERAFQPAFGAHSPVTGGGR